MFVCVRRLFTLFLALEKAFCECINMESHGSDATIPKIRLDKYTLDTFMYPRYFYV